MRCQVFFKPLMATRSKQCPVPALPGEIYCPYHFVLDQRLKKRAEGFWKLMNKWAQDARGR